MEDAAMKMPSFLKKLQPSVYVIYATLMIVYLIIERSIYSYVVYKDTYLRSNWSPYLGLILGCFFAALYYSRLVEKRKYRNIIVFGGVILFFMLLGSLPGTRELIQSLYEFFSGSALGMFRDFFQGLILGAMVGFFLYGALAFFKNLSIFIYFFIQLFYFNSYQQEISFKFFAVQFLFIIALVVIFVMVRHKNTVRTLPKGGIIAFIIIVLLFSGAAFGMSKAVNDDLNAKIDLLHQIRQVQWDQKSSNQKKSSITIDAPLENLSVRIVGLYQAPKPLYLKFELFRIDQYTSNLEVKGLDSYSMGTTYVSKTNPDLSSNKAKIIFAHFPSQGLLSAERVTAFSSYEYKLSEGILRYYDASSAQEQSVDRYEFGYETFDDRDKQSTPTTKSYYDYVYVSMYSEKYKEIRDLARRITVGYTSDLDKAKAIEKYFHENFTYTLNPHFPDKVNPIDDFLFVTKKGYCVQYAVATSIMLETIGVPSRMVGGYASSMYDADLKSYVIVAKQAHVWNEVYVSGYGWVTIDSTPYTLDPEFEKQMGTDGGVPLTEDEKVQVKIDLRASDPQISFDDVFQNIEEIPMDPMHVLQSDDDNQPPNTSEENKKKIEELQKKQEEARKRTEEFLSIVKGIIIVIVVLATVGAAGYFVYIRIRDRQKYVDDALRRKLRHIDQSVRKAIIKKYSLSEALLKESSKRFLKLIPEQSDVRDQLIQFYALWNKVMYSKTYTEEELRIIEERSKEIKMMFKQIT